MNSKMRFSLKAGERIFINGAVLSASHKVVLSLMNDAVFLLESHVLQISDATTPLRQLYFVAQALLIDPGSAKETIIEFRKLHASLLKIYKDEDVRDMLINVSALVEAERTFEALKMIRRLFDVDDKIKASAAELSAHRAA